LQYKDLSPEVRHFVFEIPEVKRIEFEPGQFVSLSGDVDGSKVTRAYSVASPPCGNRLELCLNRVNLGLFSPHLFSLQPGDVVPMKGPLGTFTLRNPLRDSVFVATGTGVAPFRSMVLGNRLWEACHRYILIQGARYEEGILYREEFEQIARRHPNFEFWPVVSRPGSLWRGRSGYVQSHVIAALGERRDIDVYICGLREMVDGLRRKLKEMGFDRKSIIYERYD
jgi:CDP-4-dehydro-6-deoxyglucose reductase